MLPHLFLGSCDDILSILDELSGCDLGVCLDTGHAYLSGRLGTDLRRLAPHLRMVHASDNRGKRDDHLPPGEGDIGWRDLISQLADVDFGGALILEIAGSEGRQRTLKRAQRSRRFLEELCRDDRRPRSR
jgi:sugar phosphate isomerase/epimerase